MGPEIYIKVSSAIPQPQDASLHLRAALRTIASIGGVGRRRFVEGRGGSATLPQAAGTGTGAERKQLSFETPPIFAASGESVITRLLLTSCPAIEGFLR